MRTLSLLSLILLSLAACGRAPSAPADTTASANGEASAPAAPATEAETPAEVTPSGPVPAALIGHWAAQPDWCQVTGEARPIEITASRFEGYENSCEITSVRPDGDGYRVAMTCHAEGDVLEETAHWAPKGEQLTISYPSDPDATVITFTRCGG